MLSTCNPADLQTHDRATPPCPHFGPCGGCQLQHLTYAAQLSDKAAQLRGLLVATGIALPELQIHPSPPLAYRNRIRLTLAEVGGQLRAGYMRSLFEHGAGHSTARPGSTERNDLSDVFLEDGETMDPVSIPIGIQSVSIPSSISFLPIRECPIAAPILWRATDAFLASINEQPHLWLRNPQQMPDQLELFTTADESRLQLTLFLRTTAKTLPKKLAADFTALCEALRTRITELAGAGISLLPALSKQRSRRAEQPRPGPTWGSPGLNYTVASLGPRTLNLGTSSLLGAARGLLPDQPLPPARTPRNRHGEPLRPVHAFDLYAGVGLFSRALATRFARSPRSRSPNPPSALSPQPNSQTSAPSKPPRSTSSASPSSSATAPTSSSSIHPAPEWARGLRAACAHRRAHAGLRLLLAGDPALRSQNSHRLGLHPRQAAPLRPLPPDHPYRNRRCPHPLKNLRTPRADVTQL